jgi:hypothetical protein
MFCSRNNNTCVYFIFASLLIVAGFSSCRRDETSSTHYLSFDSLVTAQAKYLSHSKAKLKKRASLDGKADSTDLVVPDSTGWSKELGVFLQLDMINKPIYRDLYTVHDTRDPKSNLMVRTFEGKAEYIKDLPVSSLRIFYLTDFSNIRRIEGVYNEKNTLYGSSQFLSLELQDIHNKNILTSYFIKGNQKMIMADSTQFSVAARIIIN